MIRKLCVIDTETGGLDPLHNAIISLAAVVLEEGKPVAQLSILIADPSGTFEEQALKVNGFKKDEVLAQGVTPARAVALLTEFYQKNKMPARITLVGHNVAFDIGFLRRLYTLAGVKGFDKLYNYGGLCTKSCALLLEQAGRATFASSSLANVCKGLGVPLGRETKHDAMEDALACAAVLEKMIGLLKK
jgi:CRISPR-associated protein Cas2